MEIRTINHCRMIMHAPTVPQRGRKNRTGKLHIEVDLPQFRPSGDDTVTLYCMIVKNTNLRVNNPASPTTFISRMIQIQNNLRIFVSRILITVNTGSLGCSEFRIDIFIFQHHLIIAGSRFFFFMSKCGRSTPAACRHDKNINQVGSSCTAQAGVAETINGTFIIIITGSISPVRCFICIR